MFGEFAAEAEMCEGDKQLVMDWILLTKTHSTPRHQGESEEAGDKHYFLDLDMAILGSHGEFMLLKCMIRFSWEFIPICQSSVADLSCGFV